MYKIAHISDLHVSFKDDDNHGKRLVELLIDIESRNCDHIFITGDIADNPNIEDLQYVKEILSHFELLDSSKLSVIPGNHDIFGSPPKDKEFIFFPLLCKELDFEKVEILFCNTFSETFPVNSNAEFPYLKILNGNIAVIAINSNARWSLKRNPEGSNGEIPKKDLEKIKKIFASREIKDMFKIVLIHHYLNTPELNAQYPAHSMWLKVVDRKMKFYSKKKILKLFGKYKVNLILHGHSHINEIYNIKKNTLINSSACVYPLTDDQIRKYNIISFPDETDGEKSLSIETITF